MPNQLQTFYALDALIKQTNSNLDQFDVISFDVFDTLLIRRVPDPNMIKIPVGQLVSDLAKQYEIDITPYQVRQLRNKIENRHRAENGAKHPDHEAVYDQFMLEMLVDIFGEASAAEVFERVAQFEIDLESAMIVARDALVSWLPLLKKAGKRLFLISDIYLPAKYIKQLVDHQGVLEYFEDVISSADSIKAKASGAAWPMIESNYNLDKSRWLHIGDNPISDGARPAEFGITSYVLTDIGEHHRLSLATRYNFYASKRHFWKGRNLIQWTLPLEAENQDLDPLYSDGQGFFGYLLCTFIHRLIERCKEENIERVYFCAREGWLFKQIWDALIPWFYADGRAPKSSYLYVSRMALASAACGTQGLTPINAQVARFPAGNRDFHDVCRIFKLDAKKLAPHLANYGLKTDDAIGFNSHDYDELAAQKFSRLLENQPFQADVKYQTQESTLALQRYLEQEQFFDNDKVALVDIGWLGTIQHYLSDAINERQDKPQIVGFMLGAIRMTPYRDNVENHSEGLVFDANKPTFSSSMTNTIKPVLEEICRAPHPTLVGYKMENDQSMPVFRHTDDAIGQDEITQSKYYEPLHQGIVDFAKRYGPAAQIYHYTHSELKPWLNFMYLAKVAFPKSIEINRVRHDAHQDDFFGHHKPSKQATQKDATLWTASDPQLRFNPLLRLKWYIKSALRFLQL